MIQQVRAAAQPGQPILFAVDGFKAYVTCILKVFRDPVRTGKRGRPRLIVWEDLHLITRALRRFGIDSSRSFIVGDRWSDIVAGHAAGLYTVFISRGYAEPLVERPDLTVRSLPQATRHILQL